MGAWMQRTGIIIVNTGSPDEPTPEATARYLREFLSDPRICPMHPLAWKAILNLFILPKRSPVSTAKYESIWTDEGSPLVATMSELARKVELAAGSQEGASPIVRYAMSYSSPSILDAIKDCLEADCDELTVLPLYPQGAFSTTEVVRDKVALAVSVLEQENLRKPAISFIDSYFDHPAYISAISESVGSAGFDPGDGDMLLFAFHSIPMADIAAGDLYAEQVRHTVDAVVRGLDVQDGAWKLGYQCRFDKSRKWLGPTTKEVLSECSHAKRLFVVAPNFSIDCLETLHDIDVVLREAASGYSFEFHYVPCLNDSDAHVSLIADICGASSSPRHMACGNVS